MEADKVLRAVRRTRRLSQRELAERAGVPASTVGRIESRSTSPRVRTLSALLDATGFRLVVVSTRGRPLLEDAAHDRLHDRGARHFPAHLEAGPTPSYWSLNACDWWGWERISWPFSGAPVPENTYWRRRRRSVPTPTGHAVLSDVAWEDAT